MLISTVDWEQVVISHCNQLRYKQSSLYKIPVIVIPFFTLKRFILFYVGSCNLDALNCLNKYWSASVKSCISVSGLLLFRGYFSRACSEKIRFDWPQICCHIWGKCKIYAWFSTIVIRLHIIGCDYQKKFQFISIFWPTMFEIPGGWREPLVFLRTFRHIGRSFSILWVRLRTPQPSESGLLCQTLTRDQNLVDPVNLRHTLCRQSQEKH